MVRQPKGRDPPTLQEDCVISPDEFLYMKNINGDFGEISLENLLTEKLLIQDKKTNVEYFYTNTDELIVAD